MNFYGKVNLFDFQAQSKDLLQGAKKESGKVEEGIVIPNKI